MSKLLSPTNVAAAAFSVALALLALTQYQASTAFTDAAVEANGKIVDVRTEKRAILDGQAGVFAQVEFTVEGAATPVVAELPTPLKDLGLDESSAVGSTVPILYDPQHPESVRYGRERGTEGAVVLLALALGALFVPMILKRASLIPSGGGG